MKFLVGIVFSTTYQVEAGDREEAERLAKDLAKEEYPELNMDTVNFAVEEGEEE